MAFPFDVIIGLLDTPIGTRAILKVNGEQLNTWKSINVSRSITQIAGSFSFSTANKFAGENEKWNVTTGDECTIEIAEEKILTGYIDELEDSYTLGGHDITFSGRDKTADLVDCPFDIFTNDNEFKNLTFLQIIEKLCFPLNIIVELDAALVLDTSLFIQISNYKVETGEMIYEQISTLCQQYGILPITTGNGKLFLTRAGLKRAFDMLEVGINIKANKLNQSDKNRYSIYYTTSGLSASAFNSKLIAHGELTDDYVKRTRPLIILMGDQANSDDTCQKRAAWEARIRAGTARKVETVVKGWTQKFGDIWPLNGTVLVKDDKIGVNDSFLIASINLSLDSNGGELTTMQLVHPDTFVLKERVPIPNKKRTAFDKN